MIIRLSLVFFIIYLPWFCPAQNQHASGVFRIGLTQELQKFNQFSSARVQFEKNKNLFAVNLGFSPQKASQQMFAPSFTIDYAYLWEIHCGFLGPVVMFSVDSYVFGTRFLYLHSSIGYRFAFGAKWQLFQESTVGPTKETFTYLAQKNQQFTWNYHIKLGLQYALR